MYFDIPPVCMCIGRVKPLFLSDYLQRQTRLDFVKHKLVVHAIDGWNLPPGVDPFFREGLTRGHMNGFLVEAGIRDGDLLIQSDVDEIPRAETVQLFRWCQGMPNIVHLDMTAYVYRFGFFLLTNLLSRSQVTVITDRLKKYVKK